MAETAIEEHDPPAPEAEDSDEDRRLLDRLGKADLEPRNDFDDMPTGKASLQRESRTALNWEQGWFQNFCGWLTHYKKGEYWEAGKYFDNLTRLAGIYEPSMKAPTPRQVGLVLDTIRAFPYATFKRLSDNPLRVQYDFRLPIVPSEGELFLAFKACECQSYLRKWPVSLRMRIFDVQNEVKDETVKIPPFHYRGILELACDASRRLVIVEVMPSPGQCREYEV